MTCSKCNSNDVQSLWLHWLCNECGHKWLQINPEADEIHPEDLEAAADFYDKRIKNENRKTN